MNKMDEDMLWFRCESYYWNIHEAVIDFGLEFDFD